MTDTPVVHIVDDDPAVRDFSRSAVRGRRFERPNAFFGSRISRQRRTHEKGCVLTDVRMPEMSGIELLAKMKERHLHRPP